MIKKADRVQVLTVCGAVILAFSLIAPAASAADKNPTPDETEAAIHKEFEKYGVKERGGQPAQTRRDRENQEREWADFRKRDEEERAKREEPERRRKEVEDKMWEQFYKERRQREAEEKLKAAAGNSLTHIDTSKTTAIKEEPAPKTGTTHLYDKAPADYAPPPDTREDPIVKEYREQQEREHEEMLEKAREQTPKNIFGDGIGFNGSQGFNSGGQINTRNMDGNLAANKPDQESHKY